MAVTKNRTDRDGKSLEMKKRTLRVTEKESEMIDRALSLSPYNSMRDLIAALVADYIEYKEREEK